MTWLQSPQAGPIVHAALALIVILVSAGIGYVASPDDPFRLGAPTLGLLTVLSQGLLSWYRNLGIVVTTADQVRSNLDVVEIHTHSAPAGPPPTLNHPSIPTGPDPNTSR